MFSIILMTLAVVSA